MQFLIVFKKQLPSNALVEKRIKEMEPYFNVSEEKKVTISDPTCSENYKFYRVTINNYFAYMRMISCTGCPIVVSLPEHWSSVLTIPENIDGVIELVENPLEELVTNLDSE